MTLEELKERLALYLTAERKILEGNQSYTVNGVTYDRAQLGQVRTEIASLSQQIYMLENGGAFGCQSVFFGGRR
jgi:hypothetical protein